MLRRFFKKCFRSRKRGGNFFLAIAQITGCKPENLNLYKLALTHGSASYEVEGIKYNNERLEFLGDALIGSIVAEYLYEKFPALNEGALTKWRSAIISRRMLNNIAIEYGIPNLLKTENMGSNRPKSLFGNALEALVGALFLDKGYNATRHFYITKAIEPFVDFNMLNNKVLNYKSALVVWCQKNKKDLHFETTNVAGKDHDRIYEVTLRINNDWIAAGEGKTKKQAEESASKQGYEKLVAVEHS